MAAEDPSFDALREAIAAFAIDEAGTLVGEAKAEAREKVKLTLVDALTSALLDRSAADLAAEYADASAEEPPAAAPAPAPAMPAAETVREEPPAPAPSVDPAPPVPAAAEAREQPVAAAIGDDPGDATYVFGVADAGAELPALPGIDSAHAVRTVTHGGLAAIVSTVSLDEFGDAALAQNLEDLGWIERAARAHEDVLAAALEKATVVPMRLCTIYLGDEQVEAMLDERRETLTDALDRLGGRTEWGVKLIAAPGALERAAAEEGSGGEGAAEQSPGLAYLGRKQREQRARAEADTIAAEWADDAHDRLAAVSEDSRLNPLQGRELAGYEGDMILNGAYLVGDELFPRFEGALDGLRSELADSGVAVELTGPWPAYNFVGSPAERDEVVEVGG